MNDPTTGRSSTLTVLPDGHRIIVRPGETVLQALYAAGLAYRTGCRRGGCAVCKVDIREGKVTYSRAVADTVLTAGERADGTCLTCQAVPDGDLTIELREERLRVRCRPLLALRAVPDTDAPGGADARSA